MDNRDFDNLFKNQLKGLPEKDFLFNESAWNDVEGVLIAEDILPPPKRKGVGFLPLFLLTMLLSSNLLVGWKYYNAEQEITVLNSTIQELQSSITDENTSVDDEKENSDISNDDDNNNSVSNFDNVSNNKPEVKIVEKIVTKIVYVPINNSSTLSNNINTPLNQTNLQTNQTNNNTNNNSNNLAENSTDENSSQNNQSNNNTGNGKNNLVDNTIANNAKNNTTASVENENLVENEETSILFLDLIELEELNHPILLVHQPLENIIDTSDYQYKRKLKDYVNKIGYATTVSSYELGVSSGLDLLYQTSDFNLLSKRFGLTSEITFSDYVKLGTTIDWKETKGELENIELGNYPDDYFDIYPNMVGFDPNDVLTKIETRDRNIEFAVFAKYIIRPHDKWSPYFGLGVKGAYDYEQRFEYKYLNSQGYEYETDYQYIYNKKLGFNTLLGLAGVQYKLTPSFNVRLDAMYNYDYKAHRFDNSQMNWFSTNIGILYSFRL